jgi:hypothetical protein
MVTRSIEPETIITSSQPSNCGLPNLQWDALPSDLKGKIMMHRVQTMWRDEYRKCGRSGYRQPLGLHNKKSVRCAVPGCKNNVRYSLLAHGYSQCVTCCPREQRVDVDLVGSNRLSLMRAAKCQALQFWGGSEAPVWDWVTA